MGLTSYNRTLIPPQGDVRAFIRTELQKIDVALQALGPSTAVFTHSVSHGGLNADGAINLKSAAPYLHYTATTQAVDSKCWNFGVFSDGIYRIEVVNDSGNVSVQALKITRNVTAITEIQLGNAVDQPIVDIQGQLGVGTNANLGKLAVASSNVASYLIASWDNRFSIFGPNVGTATGAALGLGYDSTNGKSTILSLAPNVAWKPLDLAASTVTIAIGGVESITFSGQPTTGAATPTLSANKPGANGGVAFWEPITRGGVQYWIPIFAN